jgi:isoquinoline 1-oxidoreductase subunit alpha
MHVCRTDQDHSSNMEPACAPQNAKIYSPPLDVRVSLDPRSTMQMGLSMFTLAINGETHSADVPADMPLLWVLRDVLGLTGTKFGCGIAQCGACTVHIDGNPMRSCVLPVGTAADHKITTIEAVGETPQGARIQKAWLDIEVVQCGYCQSGQIMSATALITRNPDPDDAAIDAAMAGNICRCCTYPRIRAAIKQAAKA